MPCFLGYSLCSVSVFTCDPLFPFAGLDRLPGLSRVGTFAETIVFPPLSLPSILV